ncbi:MAG: hypothetical protein WA876_03275 [Candidatus Acidiferrales bacterium]
MNLFSNPEILRNARIQLRPRKLLIAAAICAVLEIALYYAFFHGGAAVDSGRTAYGGGSGLLRTILIIQALVLVIGGGIACLHAIQREKDQNTFDFQRLTRLSPLELTLGKLFGPPLMVFFVFLCFIPAAIVGAVVAGTPATILFVAYVLLILGAIAYDAFALVISLFLRRGAVTWAILFFLAFVAYTSSGTPFSAYLSLGSISPFNAVSLAQQNSWSISSGMQIGGGAVSFPNLFRDLFFGIPVHHALVLFIFYITILAWLIPAVARNIKRDPGDYELYTSAQALGFLCYLNFILFAFFRWSSMTAPDRFTVHLSPLEVQSALLSVNILLFFIFGFILLRNRNQVRRALHGGVSGSMGRLETWPAPYLFLGALIVGVAMILMIQWKSDPSLEWSLAVAIFRVVFFAFWLICDFLFLQWMKLQRGSHPLVMGVLYLGVYYVCAIIIVSSLHLTHNPFTAIFLPTPLFVLNTASWSAHQAVWIIALLAQIAAGVIFAVLQRRTFAQLQPRSSPVLGAHASEISL